MGFPVFLRKDSNLFVKKPLPTGGIVVSVDDTTPLIKRCPTAHESLADSCESVGSSHTLERHLTLLDLTVIGVGCTIGSGLFVLCGLIANQHAGPASSLSWLISGLAACLSGACYAELSSRIPLAGSAYSYTFVAMGELPAILAAACLSLQYIAAASAVARSWGDKVQAWLIQEYGSPTWISWVNGEFFSPFAFLISSICVALLLNGVKESKSVTNFFTGLKVALVAFMIGAGAFYVQPSNWHPFIPPQFGVSGILRGATGTFFGYMGYDEIAVLGAEAKNPKRDLPRAIMGTIGSVTIVYISATVVLTGMVSYDQISSVSGFPVAFLEHDAYLASQVAALGEIATLPIVVLITIMGQSRLQYALAKDGLLPPVFGEIDSNGNLAKGTMISGLVVILVATFIPFNHLNDMISCAVLTALSLTDTSLVLLWHHSAGSNSTMAETIMGCFHGLALFTSLILSHFLSSELGKSLAVLGGVSMVAVIVWFSHMCPQSKIFGSSAQARLSGEAFTEQEDGYFRTPMVPFVPCLAIFINWYFITQLGVFGILLHLSFLGAAGVYYIVYAVHHSVGNNGGWDRP